MRLYLWIKRKIFFYKYRKAYKEIFENADELFELFKQKLTDELIKELLTEKWKSQE